jgi:hypothetical protein
MRTKLCSAMLGAALLASAGHASAAEPLRLSDAQLDSVTGGATAVAIGAAAALGDIVSASATNVAAAVNGPNAAAASQSASVAVATFVFAPAVAASFSQATVTGP